LGEKQCIIKRVRERERWGEERERGERIPNSVGLYSLNFRERGMGER